MKAIRIAAAAALLMSVLCLFSACGKTQAVKDAEALIGAVEELSPESGDALAAARAAVDALEESDRKHVRGLKRLQSLEADFADYQTVKTYMETLKAVSEKGEYTKETQLSDLRDRADEIRELYEKLPRGLKEAIEGVDTIDALLPAVESYAENAQTGAVAYVKAFLKLNAGKNVTVTDVFCSKQQGMDGEEKHFYALKYTDAAGAERTVYSQARFDHTITPEILLARPETFFASDPPAGDNDPVEHGNVKLDVAAVLAAAGE